MEMHKTWRWRGVGGWGRAGGRGLCKPKARGAVLRPLLSQPAVPKPQDTVNRSLSGCPKRGVVSGVPFPSMQPTGPLLAPAGSELGLIQAREQERAGPQPQARSLLRLRPSEPRGEHGEGVRWAAGRALPGSPFPLWPASCREPQQA